MSESLRLLVLGGTAWLGREVAAQAVAAGHRVTCLARGESGSPPDGARLVRADRWAPDAYEAVAEQDWDVVVDVSREPEHVRSALAALGRSTGHWVYVSSISAYADHAVPGADETADLLPPWEGVGPAPADKYGQAKVSCETACRDVMGDRVCVARAGLIVGYGDTSDRFGYWPARFARAADAADRRVVVPPLSTPVQVVDVRDLAAWLVLAGEERLTGAVDATGPRLSFGDVVDACTAAVGARPELVDPGEGRLTEAEVRPWMGRDSLPLWVPGADYAGFTARAARRARELGLRTRPLHETVEAALRWERESGLDRERHAGLLPETEHALIRRFASLSTNR